MSFSVEWSKAATKQLLSIPKKQRLIILSWVQEHLDGCEDPRRAPNGKQLQGTDSGWRWRVGVYRILARIEDGKAVIEVVRVATAKVSTKTCRGYEHPKCLHAGQGRKINLTRCVLRHGKGVS